MKQCLAGLLAALMMLTTVGCKPSSGQDAPNPAEGLVVVSTIFPGYDFARAVAGSEIQLSLLLPPGAESHSFEPTPQDIIRIQNSDLFLYVGGESEAWVSDILDTMDTSGMTILSMMELVEPLPEELVEGMQSEDDHDHEEDEADFYDEHVWTSPVNAMRITQAIADALCALDEDHAETYRSNCADYLEELAGLDAAFREVVQAGSRDTLIFGDRFPFRYFVEEYGLSYYAAYPGCAAETEASAKTVAFLMDKVEEEGIPVVFYLEFSNEKMADILCEGTGAQKRLFHSCHNVTRDELENGTGYLDLMAQNMQALKEALA